MRRQKEKSAWKNIKYDHIDKNKIINLCQFLCRCCYCNAKQYYYWKKEKLFFPHTNIFSFSRIISPTMKCKQRNATRKVHLIFFYFTKCGQSNFPFKKAKKCVQHGWMFERFDGEYLLLLSNFKHHFIDFIYYRWLFKNADMQHEIFIFFIDSVVAFFIKKNKKQLVSR